MKLLTMRIRLWLVGLLLGQIASVKEISATHSYLEDKESITFASSWKIADDHTGEQYGQLHKIPKTWIKTRKVIKL